MTAPPVREVRESQDFRELLAIVRGLAGQPCCKAALSYGEELTLHFGERVPYSHPKMAGREKGAWVLGTRASRWQLASDENILASSDDTREKAAGELAAVEGAKVVAILLHPLALSVGFENGYTLDVLPDPAGGDEDLASWELFTPGHMLLTFGPGERWSYVRSDRPA